MQGAFYAQKIEQKRRFTHRLRGLFARYLKRKIETKFLKNFFKPPLTISANCGIIQPQGARSP
nr:MAG TPA: hypothetical protein [Caudoviricetes sp.]